MTPGPDRILRILSSGTLVKVGSIASGNTFGATFWTDGKMEAPMLPETPWLLLHPLSDELFWIDGCQDVADENGWESQEKYSEVPFAQAPSLKEYRSVLRGSGGLSPDKERYLRTRCWWALNDRVRNRKRPIPLGAVSRANLLKLRSMLNENEASDRLMAAEVSRHLRDFDEANRLLTFQFPDDHARAANLIRRLTEQRDFTVRRVN